MTNFRELLIKPISFYLFCLLLFLLPWQTRYIFDVQTLGGSFWEYGSRSVYVTEILLGLALLAFLVEKLSDSRVRAMIRSSGKTRKTKLRLLNFAMFLLYVGYVVGSSALPELARQKFYYLLLAVCLGFLIFAYQKNRVFHIFWLWLGGVMQGLLAMSQFFTQAIVHLPLSGIAPQVARNLGTFVIEFGDERWLRAYGSFGSPNILGGFLAVVWVLGLYLNFYLREEDGGSTGVVATRWSRFVLTSSQKRSPSVSLTFAGLKIFIMIGQLIILAGLVVSFSRGAWIAAVVGLVTCIGVLVQQNRGREKRIEVARVVLYSAVVVSVLFFSYKPLFVTRVSGAGRLEVKSNEIRMSEFGDWWHVVKAKPFMGTGPGLYTYELSQIKPGVPGYKYQPVHNTFLLFVAEWGVVGVVVWLLVLWRVGLFVRRPVFWPLLIVFLVTAGLDHYYWSLPTGLLFGAVVFSLMLATASAGQVKNSE